MLIVPALSSTSLCLCIQVSLDLLQLTVSHELSSTCSLIMSLMLPQGQKLLTNVSVVRIKKGKDKVRACVACVPFQSSVCALHAIPALSL